MPLREDMPTVGERYITASVGDNDVVGAAAMGPSNPDRWCHYKLGLALMHLNAEYDQARTELEQAGEIAARWMKETAERDPKKRRSVVDIVVARSMILGRAPSWPEARQRVGWYAFDLAERRGLKVRPDVVIWLADRALDAWLDQTCHTCDGTGWVDGGYLHAAVLQCRTCGGTGSRRNALGKDEQQRWFAFTLIGDLQTAVDQAAGAIAARLRNQ